MGQGHAIGLCGLLAFCWPAQRKGCIPGSQFGVCLLCLTPVGAEPAQGDCCCLVAKSCPTLCEPLELEPARLPCPWAFPGKNTGLPCPSPGDLPKPGIQPVSLVSAGGFFTTEPPGKPRKEGCFTQTHTEVPSAWWRARLTGHSPGQAMVGGPGGQEECPATLHVWLHMLPTLTMTQSHQGATTEQWKAFQHFLLKRPA